MKGRLRLAMHVEHAARVAQQQLPLRRELVLARPAQQQLAAQGCFQFLELHADCRLGTVHLRRGGR